MYGNLPEVGFCLYISAQGWRKLFITGQAKLKYEQYSINVWVANNFTTDDILFKPGARRPEAGAYLVS